MNKAIRYTWVAFLLLAPITIASALNISVSEAFEKSSGSEFIAYFINLIIASLALVITFVNAVYIENKNYSTAMNKVWQNKEWFGGLIGLGILSSLQYAF